MSGHGFEPAAPPPGSQRGRRRRLPPAIWAVLGAVLVVALLGVLAHRSATRELRGYAAAARDDASPSAASDVPEAPPSERGELPTTSVPALAEREDERAPATAGDGDFRELTCEFTGTARLDPPIPAQQFLDAARRTMELEPGAAFECDDGQQESSGVVGLTVDFAALDAFSGVGSGEGGIAWTAVAAEEREPGVLAPESRTVVEIQVQLPVVVVWTTIVDGPYAG